MSTPIAVCVGRDPKGLYARARAYKNFFAGMTGIDDPYEPPRAPEITVDTTEQQPQQSAGRVLEVLEQRGLVPPAAGR